MPGKVYIVGAGVGNPEYITVKALNVLKTAGAVVYDRLIPKGILDYCSEEAELVYAGKAPGRHALSQDEINNLLYKLAHKHKTVVRLKGGDPLVFGRGEEECIYLLERNVPCEIIPGITSFQSAAAKYLIPLAGRGVASAFTVATGIQSSASKDKLDYKGLAGVAGTLVFVMSASQSSRIIGEVASARGWSEHGVIIERIGYDDEKAICGTLETLKKYAEETGVRNPAILVIGKSVELGARHGWVKCM
jgi:uroporphyrin-III C-methyltransferase